MGLSLVLKLSNGGYFTLIGAILGPARAGGCGAEGLLVHSPVINRPGTRSIGMTEQREEEVRRKRFEALLAEWRDDLYRYAFWLVRDRGLAEDVLQETLLRAWKSIDSLKDDGSAKSWLITILRREHARVYERKRLDTTDVDALAGADQLALASAPDERLQAMREAILMLADDYREPLVLQVMMGYSTSEIAEQLGISLNAALTRLFRARKQLKAILDGQDGGERNG